MPNRILVIAEIGCGPPYHGNRSRMRSLLSEIRGLGYRIDFAGVRFSRDEKEATLPHVDRWVHSFNELPLEFFLRRYYGRARKFLRRRLGGESSSSATDYAALDQWFNPRWLRETRVLQGRENYRRVLVAYVFHSAFLEAFPASCRKILDAHDSFAGRHERIRSVGLGKFWFSCGEQEERAGLERADIVLAIQEEEAGLFGKLLRGKPDVQVVGHFVEPRAVSENPGAHRRIGYIGAYNPLNLQGLQWFLREVWPVVLAECPDAEFQVAGSICRWLEPSDTVKLLGKVPDVSQFHADCLCTVNPMPQGTGLKIKTVESLACGRPVVGTRSACEGLGSFFGKGLVRAETATEFADGIVHWLQNPSEARRAGRSALDELSRLIGQWRSSLAHSLELKTAPSTNRNIRLAGSGRPTAGGAAINWPCRSLEPTDAQPLSSTATQPFSVCCLVTDPALYGRLRQSLRSMGFDDHCCEFLVADNTAGNIFPPFAGVRRFLREARGPYVMIVHQDAIPLEPAAKLLARIAEVEKADPLWGVIGNAGRTRRAKPALSLVVENETFNLGQPFQEVETIDENVIIVRNGAGITVSADTTGFHLYAFDLCSVAARLGYRTYVVDHLWRHDSRGMVNDSFFEAKRQIEGKMRRYSRRRAAPTTCTALCWSSSPLEHARAQALSLRLIGHPVHRKAWWQLWWRSLVTNPLFLGYFAYYVAIDAWGWVVRRMRKKQAT